MAPETSATQRRAETSAPSQPELRRRVYQYTDLSNYSFTKRLMIRAGGLLFYCLITLISVTIRWTVVEWRHYEAICRAGKRIIFTFWHNRVFLATWFWRRRGIVVMTSRSDDGEYIARFIQRFGYGAARGSSTRGGLRALKLMGDCLSHGIDTAFTIDGPRGPRYVAKPGAVQLAKITGQPILPFHISAKRFWQLKSWDRFQIPVPFTRAVVLLGEPIYVASHSSSEELAHCQRQLQTSLDELRQRGDQWWVDQTSEIRHQTSGNRPRSEV